MGLAGKRAPLIFCVDDEPGVLTVNRTALERHGFRVKLVSRREQALALAERTHDAVSVVILDWMMPGMEIREVIGRLRELQPEMKIVLSSGYDRATAAIAVAPATVDGFLQKPYTPKQLIHVVQQALKPSAVGMW